jgi:hypothetical protein
MSKRDEKAAANGPAATAVADEGTAAAPKNDEFYCRYYVGHKGNEFLEFEFHPDGLLRYANNSEYKKDHMIRKEGISLYYFCSLCFPVLSRSL